MRQILAGIVIGLVTAGPLLAADENAGSALPAPRDAQGNVIISRMPGEKAGIWVPDYRIGATPIFNIEEIAFKPWAKGLYDTRQTHDLEPHARCKASGGIRQLLTPYGVEILDLPELKQLYIFDIGGPHTFRTVYMDGRSHPHDLEPTNYGHSIGWWDGDTLVIDSVGYNTDFWFERAGLPHTEAAHVIEYFTRTDLDTMAYRFVLEDERTYDGAVVGTLNLRWSPEEELFEYICQQSNYASDLMVNESTGGAVGSTSDIIP